MAGRLGKGKFPPNPNSFGLGGRGYSYDNFIIFEVPSNEDYNELRMRMMILTEMMRKIMMLS